MLGTTRPAPIGFTAAFGDEHTKGQSIIPLQEGDRQYGITADSVEKMARLEDQADLPAQIKGIDPKLVRGIRMEDDQKIILQNLERLFYAH